MNNFEEQMKDTTESVRARVFNKIWSKIMNLKAEQISWNKAPHAFLENEEESSVNEWFDKELEHYDYILKLIKKDR